MREIDARIANFAALQMSRTIVEARAVGQTPESVREWLQTKEGELSVSFVSGWVKGAVEIATALGQPRFPTFGTGLFGLTPLEELACLERLVVLGLLREIPPEPPSTRRIFAMVPTEVESPEVWL